MLTRPVAAWFLCLPLLGCGCVGHPAADPRVVEPEPPSPAETYARLRAVAPEWKPPDRAALLAALKDDNPHVRRAAVFTLQQNGADAEAVEALTPLLKDRDLFLRVVAAAALWDLAKHPDAIPVLRQALKDSSLHVRTHAVRALGDIGPDAGDAADDLTALLRTSDASLQIVIAAALIRIRRADVPVLADAMAAALGEAVKSGDYRAHKAMTDLLRVLGKDAVPPLIELLRKHDDPYQQKAAALALAPLGADARDAVPALVALLRVEKYHLRVTAVDVLARIGPGARAAVPGLLALLDDADEEVRRQAAAALGAIGKPALPGLAANLRAHKRGDPWPARLALAAIGKDAAPPLLEMLRGPDEELRVQAAAALGEMAAPPEEVAPLVMQLLRDVSGRRCGYSLPAATGAGGAILEAGRGRTLAELAQSSGSFGAAARDAVPLLIPLLKAPRHEVRAAAAFALGRFGPDARQAMPALRDLLKEGADDPRHTPAAVSAARALLATGSGRQEDVPLLIEVLRHEGLHQSRGGQAVQAGAAQALARLGPDAEPAVPALLAALTEPVEPTLLEAVRDALGQIGKAAVPELHKLLRTRGSPLRKATAPVWTRIGKAAIPALVEALKDEDAAARRIAARCLGEMGPDAQSAAPALLEALADPDDEVREYAARALPVAGADAGEAVPALRDALADAADGVRKAAVFALTDYGPDARPAVSALLDALKGGNEDTRFAALAALRAAGAGPKPIVAVLLGLLNQKDAWANDFAARALRGFGGDAQDAVPRLRELRGDERAGAAARTALWHLEQDAASVLELLDKLRHPDVSIREHAAFALAGDGAAAAVVVPALTDAARDRDPAVQRAALYALKKIGPAARPAVPVLVTLVKEDTSGLHADAAAALGMIGAAARDAVPALKARLKEAPPATRAALWLALWQIGRDQDAVAALGELLKDKDAWPDAAEALEAIGPAARDAVPALRAALARPDTRGPAVVVLTRALRKVERD